MACNALVVIIIISCWQTYAQTTSFHFETMLEQEPKIKKLLIESAKSTLRLYRTRCLLLSDEITMSLLSHENIC